MKKNQLINSALRTAAALLVMVTLSFTGASPALALDLNPADYFKFNFEPTAFDKSTVSAGDVFYAVIKGSADCTQDLPLPITEISIKSQVVARPVSGGADLLLNPEYVIGINPLPNKAGESFEINQAVNLQFPAGAAPGNYVAIALLTEAKVNIKVLFTNTTLDVTGSFPAETLMGAVRYAVPSTAPATTPPAAGTVTPVTAPAITLPPSATLNPGNINAATTENFPLTTIVIIGLIVVIVILLIIVIFLLRGRGN